MSMPLATREAQVRTATDLTPGTEPWTPTPEAVYTARCRWICRLAAILLCGLHAWGTRHSMSPDGICYLDVADAYARGDLAAALNSYWSPLYSWLLAGTLAVVEPGLYWESAVVHALNFVIFLGVLAAFEWLLSEWLRYRRRAAAEANSHWQATLPDWLAVGLAYTLFLWTSRRFVTVSLVTPDLCVAALVYCAAALLLRLRRRGPSRWTSLLLGAVLGLGYLAKAIMFPLAFVFLAVSWRAAGRGRQAVLHLLLAGAAFLAVAGPFLIALSVSQGRLLFGDSGRLNYLWNVGGVRLPHCLASSDPPAGAPLGPRPAVAGPAMTVFPLSAAGTYPLWYDPARWYPEAAVRFDARAQAAAVAQVATFYYELFSEHLLCFSGAVAMLYGFAFFARRQGWRSWLGSGLRNLAGQYHWLVPALAALGLYLLVGHAEYRLIGPFVLLLVIGLLEGLRLYHPQQVTVRPLGAALLTGIGVLLGCTLIADAGTAWAAVRRGEEPEVHPAWRVARALAERGLKPGDGVGSIGYTYNAYWARLGRYRLAAEVCVPEAARFWAAGTAGRAEVLRRFRQAGARAVVCDAGPTGVPGWEPVPGTRYAIRWLSPEGEN
jgi:hypothetical protein